MNQEIEDLILILRAIELARKRWLDVAEAKWVEFKIAKPELTHEQCFSRALLSLEAQEEFQKVQNLYGIIGDSAVKYREVLLVLTKDG